MLSRKWRWDSWVGLSYKIRFYLDLEIVLFLKKMSRYFDIDDIIMEEEVEQGSRVELPLWLANELYLRQAVSVNVPPCFNLNWMTAEVSIQRDKVSGKTQHDTSVTKNQRNGEWMKRRAKLANDISTSASKSAYTTLRIGDRFIGSFLLYAFMDIFKDILSKAHSAAFAVAPRFLPLLTKEEMQHNSVGIIDSIKSMTNGLVSNSMQWPLTHPRLEP
ncbi:hypothetical protein Scep_027865 [Stephania cephalantha]|uniref:DNA replication complex GINS protein PSF3 n=1 Tax=Stephania cephalantha TaxID=152367 RepID=A0AAP0HHL9_9MAGN